MSNFLKETILAHLPDGLPTRETINRMTTEEMNELFDKQKQIISDFRCKSVSRISQMQTRLNKSLKTLSSLGPSTEKATIKIEKTPAPKKRVNKIYTETQSPDFERVLKRIDHMRESILEPPKSERRRKF